MLLSRVKVVEYFEARDGMNGPEAIPIFMTVTFFAMIIIFFGWLPILASMVCYHSVATTFLPVQSQFVMGETGIEPVSGTSFIVLRLLLGVFLSFDQLLGLDVQEAVLLSLIVPLYSVPQFQCWNRSWRYKTHSTLVLNHTFQGQHHGGSGCCN